MSVQLASSSVGPQRAYKVKLCQFFAHGACTRGSQCSYAHGPSELPRSQRQEYPQGAPRPQQPLGAMATSALSRRMHSSAEATVAADRANSHQDISGGEETLGWRAQYEPLLVKTKLCRFFGIGRCNRGAKCSFAHSTQELNPNPDLRCMKLCPSVIKHGACENPSSCPFAHSGLDICKARSDLLVKGKEGYNRQVESQAADSRSTSTYAASSCAESEDTEEFLWRGSSQSLASVHPKLRGMESQGTSWSPSASKELTQLPIIAMPDSTTSAVTTVTTVGEQLGFVVSVKRGFLHVECLEDELLTQPMRRRNSWAA